MGKIKSVHSHLAKISLDMANQVGGKVCSLEVKSSCERSVALVRWNHRESWKSGWKIAEVQTEEARVSTLSTCPELSSANDM